MRLSFGQEMRLAQKQVLAPRMIQSMEILQLPILALQERIDQELQENPASWKCWKRIRICRRRRRTRGRIDSGIDEERELVIDEANGEDDFERLLNMDEEWPDHFQESSRALRATGSRRRSDRKHDAMANMVARAAVSAGLPARSTALAGYFRVTCVRWRTESSTISIRTATSKAASGIFSARTRRR